LARDVGELRRMLLGKADGGETSKEGVVVEEKG